MIESSQDLWADEVNIEDLSCLYNKFLELATKYGLSQEEIDRLSVFVYPYVKITGTA